MKKLFIARMVTAALLLAIISCRHEPKQEIHDPSAEVKTDTSGLVKIGSDIITDIIVRPDTLSDPWEAEKVDGYDGNPMFTALLEKIYNGEITVFDCMEDRPLKPSEVNNIAKEFSSDVSKIGKFQFVEDWYFNPSTSSLTKKIKSVSFGYEYKREPGLPKAYKAFFRLKQ